MEGERIAQKRPDNTKARLAAALLSKCKTGLVLFQLGVELVLVLVVRNHFVAAGEGAVAEGVADFRIGAHHLADFGVDVLEEEVVARHGYVVLVVVQVVAAFERLEELGLAGIFRRLAVGHREVALLDANPQSPLKKKNKIN